MSKEIIVERGTKTVYREGSKIVKQFKAGYPKSAVIKEAFNHALAEESGLNVPALLEVKNTGEGWALVIEAVEGKTMAQLMAEQPENLEALMTQFVEIQSDIHRRTCKQMGRLKDKLNAQISSLRDELDASTRYELHVRLENMKPHTKITHGDFNPTNVLIGADGTVYILDWAHAAIGAGGSEEGRPVFETLLQEERHRHAVCPALAAHRRRRADDQEARRGKGVPDPLDAGCRV